MTRCGVCVRCRLAARDERYGRFACQATGETGPAGGGPCARRSADPIPGPRRQALGLAHAREWYDCAHPAAPLGPHVCACQGCGPSCRGYERPTVAGDDD